MKRILTILFSVALALQSLGFTTNDPARTATSDGTPADTQAALNYITAKNQDFWVLTVGTTGGTYNWASGVSWTIPHVFTIQGATNNPLTIIQDTVAGHSGAAFSMNGSPTNINTIRNFHFKDTGVYGVHGFVANIAISGAGVCFRVTNCRWSNRLLQSPPGARNEIMVGNLNSSLTMGPYGLIDNCQWIFPESGILNCIHVRNNGSGGNGPYRGAYEPWNTLNGNPNYSWTQPMSFGTVNAVYVERCSFFSKPADAFAGRGAFIESDAGARICARFNAITNLYWSSHGRQSGAYDSTMQQEGYGNYFMADRPNQGMPFNIFFRGGTTLLFSNVFNAIGPGWVNAAIKLAEDCSDGANCCNPGNGCPYQIFENGQVAFQQIGTGSSFGTGDGVGFHRDPAYIWNNSFPGSPATQIGGAVKVSVGREYFLSPKPGYAPLGNHPLATGGALPPDTNSPPAESAPVILTQPASISRVVGQQATFTVTMSAGNNLVFQWKTNGVAVANGGTISGATTSQLVISSVTTNDALPYLVVITNAQGAVTSSVASLEVTLPPPAESLARYVDQSAGSDSNAGTSNAPWKNCPGMVLYTGGAELTNGMTVYLDRSDTWQVKSNSSGAAGFALVGGVTYIGDQWDPEAAATGRAIIQPTNRCESGVINFRYDSTNYVTSFEGFDVNANGFVHDAIGMNFPFAAGQMIGATKRISRCLIHGNVGNESVGDYKFGVAVSDNSPDASARVANVEILDNVIYSVPRCGIAIIPGANGRVDNVLIRGNDISYVTNDVNNTDSSDGVLIRGDVRGISSLFNVVHHVSGSTFKIDGPQLGFHSRGPSNVVIQCNLLSTLPTSTNGTIRVRDTTTTNVVNNKQIDIVGNIIMHTNAIGGLSFMGNAGGLTARVYNNTFWDTVVDIGDPTGATTIDFQNNIIKSVVVIGPQPSLTDAGSDVTTHTHNMYGVQRSSGSCLVVVGGVCKTSFDVSATWEPTTVGAQFNFKNTNAPPTGFTGTYPALVPSPDGLMADMGASVVNMGAPLGNQFALAINSVVRSSSMAMGNWDVGAYEQDVNTPPIPPQIGPQIPGVKNATILILP